MGDTQRIGGGFFDISGNLDGLMKDLERAKGLVKRGVGDIEKDAKVKIGIDTEAGKVDRVRKEVSDKSVTVRPPIPTGDMDDLDDATRKIGDSLSRAQSLAGGFVKAIGAVAGIAGAAALMKQSFDAGMDLAESQKQLAVASSQSGRSFSESMGFVKGLQKELNGLTATTEAETAAMVALGINSRMTFDQIAERAKASASLAQGGLQDWKAYFAEFAKVRMFGQADFGLIAPAAPGLTSLQKEQIALAKAREMEPAAREARKLPSEEIKELRKEYEQTKATFGQFGMEMVVGLRNELRESIKMQGGVKDNLGGLTDDFVRQPTRSVIQSAQQLEEVSRASRPKISVSDDSLSRDDRTGMTGLAEEIRKVFAPLEAIWSKAIAASQNQVTPTGKRQTIGLMP